MSKPHALCPILSSQHLCADSKHWCTWLFAGIAGAHAVACCMDVAMVGPHIQVGIRVWFTGAFGLASTFGWGVCVCIWAWVQVVFVVGFMRALAFRLVTGFMGSCQGLWPAQGPDHEKTNLSSLACNTDVIKWIWPWWSMCKAVATAVYTTIYMSW